MKLLIIVNVDWFFISHRLPIAIEALKKGYEVHIATTITNPALEKKLISKGFKIHKIFLDRSGKNLFSIIRGFFQIFNLLRNIKPDILHLVTFQPILFGGISARILKINKIIYAISGLGHIFISPTLISKLRKKLFLYLYRFSLSGKNRIIIFQNPNDKFLLCKFCAINESETKLIPGSGVDLDKFKHKDLPDGIPIIIMASRLIISKGVREFVNSARIIKEKGYSVRFQLIGKPDESNPLAIKNKEIRNWISNGDIEYLGFRNDIHKLIPNSHIVVLPSYYPEGLPKVLSEAAACGRAIITSDKPGCRDAIEENVTGLVIPPKESNVLANAILLLLQDKDKLKSMSIASRKRAEKIFDINKIVRTHIDIYNYLAKIK